MSYFTSVHRKVILLDNKRGTVLLLGQNGFLPLLLLFQLLLLDARVSLLAPLLHVLQLGLALRLQGAPPLLHRCLLSLLLLVLPLALLL